MRRTVRHMKFVNKAMKKKSYLIVTSTSNTVTLPLNMCLPLKPVYTASILQGEIAKFKATNHMAGEHISISCDAK